MKSALVALALSALACGKQTFLAAAFVQTPALPNPQDPTRPFPQFQVVTAYFGTIDTTNPTNISANLLAPITDATAQVAFHHVKNPAVQNDADADRLLSVPAQNSPAGSYSLSSADQSQLTFETGTQYRLVLQTAGPDGDAYGASFTPGAPADIVEFQNSSCTVLTFSSPRCVDGQLSTSFTITRTDAASSDLLPAFVVVGRVDPLNPSAQPQVTYQTVPATAADLLKYVLSDRDYRKPSFTIPPSAFPQAGLYIVTLLTVKQGKVSSNTFLGSTALVAAGAAGIRRVQ